MYVVEMNKKNVLLLSFVLFAFKGSLAITVGPGPVLSNSEGAEVDKMGVAWYEEFQDWSSDDVRALDGVGDEYLFYNGYDDSRDAIALYSHDDGTNVYFRLDFYDLGYEAQGSEVDVYVAIDCATGGQPWLPDYTDTQTDHPWEVCIGVYNSGFASVYDVGFTNRSASAFVGYGGGGYWRSDLDGVEFGVSRAFLISQGWDGTSPFNIQAFTARDGTHGGDGEISGSDVVDTIGCTLTRDTGSGSGMLNGAVTTSSTTSRAKYAVIAHANQSVNTRSGTQNHIYTDDSGTTDLHPGFVRLLDSAEMLNVPINLHVSGTLLMSFLWAEQDPSEASYPARDGPTFLGRMSNFVTNGPGSLIGGVLAEHIMPYFEGDVNARSIEQNSRLIEHLFGLSEQDMKVMHVPERVIRSNTGHEHVDPAQPLDGKTFEEIEDSGFTATYLDEVTHLHWWFYSGETNNAGWDDDACGRWAGWMGNDEETYHHKVHKINGVYTFMINDREDQAKFGNYDDGMQLDTRYSLLQKAMHADAAQLTLVFDDWEAFAGNSFASDTPNNNATQFHRTLRWAANHQWIELVNLRDVATWAESDPAWVIDHGYVYDKSSQTYEWLKRASEHSYDNWYYGGPLEESFFDRVPVVHWDGGAWSPAGMKKYGDMNTTNTLIRDSWDTIQQITSTNLRDLAEWSYSAMIYETAWHDEDANADLYQSRNYQITFNRSDGCTTSYEDTTYDEVSDWAVRLHGHVRDMGVLKDASDWVERIKAGTQTELTSVYAKDVDDDTLDEYILCNNKVYLCFERWGARLIKAFVYDDALHGGDAREVIGTPVTNPADENENEGKDQNRCSAFKDRYSDGVGSDNRYVDMDYAFASPVALDDAWSFVSKDGLVNKTVRPPAGVDAVQAVYGLDGSVGKLYARFGLGPNQMDLMLNGTANLADVADTSFRGLKNAQGGEAYVVAGANCVFVNGAIDSAGWDNREMPLTEQYEVYNTSTGFSVWVAFSEQRARDLDGDGLSNTNEVVLGTNHENADTDADGMDDGYEVTHNLLPGVDDAAGDKDEDGADNLSEYLSNTSASDSTSVFEVRNLMLTPQGVSIDFSTAPERGYQIFYTDAADPLVWHPFSNIVDGVGTWQESSASETNRVLQDDFSAGTSGGSSPARWYRMEVLR